MNQTSWFSRFSKSIANYSGHPLTFGVATVSLIVWALLGPIYHFDEAWQMVVNTATTIVTFLMVFLIQNAQNRESRAVQIKLDELIRATRGAHTALLDLEELSDDEIAAACRAYHQLAALARREMRDGKADTGTPPVMPSA